MRGGHNSSLYINQRNTLFVHEITIFLKDRKVVKLKGPKNKKNI